MAKRYSMGGETIESRPKKLVKDTENTRNTRLPRVTRLVKDQGGKENRWLV